MTFSLPPIDPSALLFSPLSKTHHTLPSALSRRNLGTTISARLHSIARDAAFVSDVAAAYGLPLVANERCGSWYIAPATAPAAGSGGGKKGSAYFKSTDGHWGEWRWSARRLNLGVLGVVGASGGCIITDSTRRGKSMPDALSKTVPIWLAVLNTVLFPADTASHALRTPVNVVSSSEHAQIAARLPAFVAEMRALELDVEGLKEKLGGKAMWAEWVTPESELPAAPPAKEGRHLVVLCTASGRTEASENQSSEYVQGAADDHESWARGLDAETFWRNSEELLETAEEDLPGAVEAILARSIGVGHVKQPVPVKPTIGIWLGDNEAAERLYGDFDIVVSCSEKPSDALAAKLKANYVHLACTTGKIGSRQLRAQLPKLEHIGQMTAPKSRILITCQTGKDVSVGAALACICLFCVDDGSLDSGKAPSERTKTLIKKRLSWIMVSAPDTSPSRATLQSVNAFLLAEP